MLQAEGRRRTGRRGGERKGFGGGSRFCRLLEASRRSVRSSARLPVIETRSTHTHTFHTAACTVIYDAVRTRTRTKPTRFPGSPRKAAAKSALPPQIFTQEQLYCRNITHQSRSIIRSIFSAPLPPPRPRRLGSGPVPLAARVLYMCTEPHSA